MISYRKAVGEIAKTAHITTMEAAHLGSQLYRLVNYYACLVNPASREKLIDLLWAKLGGAK
jgi:hypothetical protein